MMPFPQATAADQPGLNAPRDRMQTRRDISNATRTVIVVLENISGGAVSRGSVVVYYNGGTRGAFTTSTTIDDNTVIGVTMEAATGTSQAPVRVAIGGTAMVRVVDGTSPGTYLQQSATAGVAQGAGGSGSQGTFGYTIGARDATTGLAEAVFWRLPTGLDAHLADTSDAHDASAISNVPAGSVAATTVQAAIDELDTDKQAILSGGAWLEISVNLTDTQLKNLGSGAQIEIIPAPGANKIIEMLSASIALDNAAGVYAGGAAHELRNPDTTARVMTLAAAAFFTAEASASKVAYASHTSATAGLISQVNAAINIGHSSTNMTGGNAANKATVRVVYRILSTLPA